MSVDKDLKVRNERLKLALNYIPNREELKAYSRKYCSVCKRKTPHVHNVCSWHTIEKDNQHTDTFS